MKVKNFFIQLLIVVLISISYSIAGSQISVSEEEQKLLDKYGYAEEFKSSKNNIDATIQLLKKMKISANNLEESIKSNNLQILKSDPSCTVKDEFESDQDYIKRMTQCWSKINNSKNEDIGIIWDLTGLLYDRNFDLSDIILELKNYDANTETYFMSLKHNIYLPEKLNLEIKIPKDQARLLKQNPKNIVVNGKIGVDFDDTVRLRKLSISENFSKFFYTKDLSIINLSQQTKILKQESLLNQHFVPTFQNNSDKVGLEQSDGKFIHLFYTDRNATSVGLSPNGQYLAATSLTQGGYIVKSIKVFYLASMEEIISFDPNMDGKCVSFSNDSRYLAVGLEKDFNKGSAIMIFDIERRTMVSKVEFNNKRLSVVAFSNDNQYLAIGLSLPQEIKICDFFGNEVIKSFDNVYVNSIYFSPENRFLITPKHIFRFTKDTDSELSSLGISSEPNSIKVDAYRECWVVLISAKEVSENRYGWWNVWHQKKQRSEYFKTPHIFKNVFPGVYTLVVYDPAANQTSDGVVLEDVSLKPDGSLNFDFEKKDFKEWNCLSCPWLYIFDGKQFIRKTEILKDFVGCENISYFKYPISLKALNDDNNLIIRICEEKQETTYLDRIVLNVDGEYIYPNNSNSSINNIKKIDTKYVILCKGDYIELIFHIPSEKLSSNIVLEAYGYYSPDIEMINSIYK